MSTNKLNIGLHSAGDTFCVTVSNVENVCNSIITGVKLTLVLPASVEVASYTIPKGSFDSVQNIWTVGSLSSMQLAEAEFCFRVLDDTTGSYYLEFQVSSNDDCGDCFEDPVYCVLAEGISCFQLNSNCTQFKSVFIGETNGSSLTTNDGDLVTETRVLSGLAGSVVGSVIPYTGDYLGREGFRVPQNCSKLEVRGKIQFYPNANTVTKIFLMHSLYSNIAYGTDTSLNFTVIAEQSMGSMAGGVVHEVSFDVLGSFKTGDLLLIGIFADGNPGTGTISNHRIEIRGI